ncbi:TetR/AcrR family transcriptional regulator [Pseudonocardia humida]|uniref:TetR/AcrR family transcriptional regulator n=1 Tax=Pseudonocardia humida TaxID=2800819 RepID=A0ABT0ZXR9_9PSEU|nr:TetR/AcrR family transcriptional regulator [Pseudonocardia humida]MCO1655521.1 TetR/AcrR family transcriptional regulator [Pseudonocardia humida]
MSSAEPARLDGRLSGRVPRAVRERQLLDIAEKLFVRHGYDGTSIEDVARAAGVTRPVVYEHHGDKDGLFVACVRRARREFEQALATATAGAADADVPALLGQGAELFFARLQRDPRRCALLLTTGSGPLGERLADLRDGTVDRVAALIAVHAPELTDPAVRAAAARVVVGAAEELARWWLRSPDVPRERVVEHFRTFVTPGLLAAIGAARAPGPPRARSARG